MATTELTERNNVGAQSPAWSTEEERNAGITENIGKGNFWVQYKALVIRNFTLKLRERRKTITEFVMPLYFILVLALFRLLIQDPTFDKILTPHGEAPVKSNIRYLNYQTLHVAPNNTEAKVVIDIVQKLAFKNGVVLKSVFYETMDDILDKFKTNRSAMQFAIIFSEDLLANMSYTLRLNPTHLVSPSQVYGFGQECRKTFQDYISPLECPAWSYFSSGFAVLQSLIDTALIQVATNRTAVMPDVLLQLYPKDEFTSSNTFVLRSIVPLYMVFAWAQFIIYMMMLVVEEKEKRIKEGMKIMGLRDSVYWLSWFTIYGGYVVVLSLICIIILPLAKVFVHVNLFLLFILFLLYGCSSIVFALMLTPFFNKAKVAGVVGNLTQVAFSLLYYLQVYLGDKISPGTFWAMGLFSPCAFSMAIDKVLNFDFYGGLDFDRLWEGEGLPFAGSLIMISLDIFIYLSLAYYLDNVVPSEYGTKRKPWFIFEKSFWIQPDKGMKFSKLLSGENSGFEDDAIPESPDLERVSAELKGKAAVRIRHLKKIFHPRGKNPVTAVDGISLDIYENQITAILGHNGAGKTTLFNILTGMLAPTSGSATVFGMDISDANDLTDIRRVTGVCPQHDIIFMTLTPREHLSFFARIRGIPSNRVTAAVENTLREVDLASKADTKGADLSGGQKRKLSIGIALIGDPRIIFLDEPTAGVDAYSRRRLWALLKNRKQGKVILLTTHFMDEADILADRKAIISKGRLRCCGSSLFLKNKFGLGYHLTLVVDDEVEESTVTKELRKVIKEAQLARHYGKEMSFILPTESVSAFPDLFTLLDQHIKKEVETVGIEGYGISMTTLEEVFLALSGENEVEGSELQSVENIGQQIIREKTSASSSPVHHSSPEILIKDVPSTSNGTEGFAINAVEVRPSRLRTFKALLHVRMINTIREPAAVFFLVILPLIFTCLSIYIISLQDIVVPEEDVLPLSAALYGSNSGALMYNNTNHELDSVELTLNSANIKVRPYNGQYIDIFNDKPSWTSWSIDSYSLDGMKTINMTMGFNDTYIHSIPILLNILSNSILNSAGVNNSISLYSQLLPMFETAASFDVASFFAPTMIGFTFTMMPAGLGIELVQDRETKIRDLLRLNGVGFHMYFLSVLCVMMVMYIINYIGLLIIIAAFNLSSLTVPAAFAVIALLYLMYMPCALLYSSVFCYIFDKSETARQFYPSMATTIGFIGYTAVAVVDMKIDSFSSDENPAFYTHIALTILIPHYIPFGILYYVNRVYIICSADPTCSIPEASDYLNTEIIIMFIMILVDIPLYYILLRLADALKLGGNWKEAFWIKGPSKTVPDREMGIEAPSGEDDDVCSERAVVSQALRDVGETPPVLIYDLGKVYLKGKEKNPFKRSNGDDSSFVALKSVSLEVKSGQVFGLLGPNGAGKTTTLQIMTAQESPSKGQVRICGTDVTSSLSEVFSNLGYCPQHDSLWKNITVAEHIACFASVRGVQKNQVKLLTELYLKGLEIMEHKSKKSKNCSGGTKRKLSYILSMIGKPQVVLLDEPSTGMDPQSKRFLWNSILASFKGQRSAILTTHSMEEADALCSRIGILVRGGLRCIGAIQHLKNKYGGGYNLELKLSPETNHLLLRDLSGPPGTPEEGSERGSRNDQMSQMVMEAFPNAHVDEQFEERIVYKIPQNDVTSLAGCFSMLEEAKGKSLLQEYALSQTTLEQVFLKFAREQEEDNDIPLEGGI
ncbi:cholesterol transporter ABCA5-like [Palaemon carinicauda]|uniref:cholesterol transporter ABCA5-like n=1 Tax=Palaemon carinicauda TaxID=392227 RepID=UPI0035B656A0